MKHCYRILPWLFYSLLMLRSHPSLSISLSLLISGWWNLGSWVQFLFGLLSTGDFTAFAFWKCSFISSNPAQKHEYYLSSSDTTTSKHAITFLLALYYLHYNFTVYFYLGIDNSLVLAESVILSLNHLNWTSS